MKVEQLINEQPQAEDFLSQDRYKATVRRKRWEKTQERKRFIKATVYIPNYGFDAWCE